MNTSLNPQIHLIEESLLEVLSLFLELPEKRLLFVFSCRERMDLVLGFLKSSEYYHKIWNHCFFVNMDEYDPVKLPLPFKKNCFLLVDEISQFDWGEIYPEFQRLLEFSSHIFAYDRFENVSAQRNFLSLIKEELGNKLIIKKYSGKRTFRAPKALGPKWFLAYMEYLLNFTDKKIIIVCNSINAGFRWNKYWRKKGIEAGMMNPVNERGLSCYPWRVNLAHKDQRLWEARCVDAIFLDHHKDHHHWLNGFYFCNGDREDFRDLEIYCTSLSVFKAPPGIKILTKVSLQKSWDFLCAG